MLHSLLPSIQITHPSTSLSCGRLFTTVNQFIYAVILLCCIAMYAIREDRNIPVSILQLYTKRMASEYQAVSTMKDMNVDTVARPVQICKPSINPVTATTKFAVVSMLSVPHNHQNEKGYFHGAAKLGVSIRRFSSLDMIMLAVDLGNEAPKLIQNAGWKWCSVPVIHGPNNGVKNRFIDSFMYSKLWAWSLVEYDAVFYIDADAIVLSDFSQIFTKHFPAMKARGVEIAMARDSPQESTNTCTSWRSRSYSEFNAGVLIIIPSTETYSSLVDAIDTLPHDSGYAEQGLITSYFQPSPNRLYRLYILPWYFNYNLVSVYCEPGIHPFGEIVVAHFTVSKPWQHTGVYGCESWHTTDYCMLWESLPESLPNDWAQTEGNYTF
jgi:hypothetical protein